MLKKLARAVLKTARRWLEEDEVHKTATNVQRVEYPPPVGWCAKISELERERPNYVWGVVHAAALARALGIPQISVVELGVAGGRGLVALERIAKRTGELCGLGISVYGFDTGIGLPKPTDYRDLPNLFAEGFYRMDAEKLRARLGKAKLTLGLVEDTISNFLNSNPPPIGFVAFDLDFYSSTKHALRLFEADEKLLLPRIYCYFDDIIGFTYSEFTGELLAISEFNASHPMRKISLINGLRYFVPANCRPGPWMDQFYLAHFFDHTLYGEYDGSNPHSGGQIPDPHNL